MLGFSHLLPSNLMVLLFLCSTLASSHKKLGEKRGGSHHGKYSNSMELSRETICTGMAACPGTNQCLDCTFPPACPLGAQSVANCTASTHHCLHHHQPIQRAGRCRFCWQLEDADLECEVLRNCSTNDVVLHKTVCRAKPGVICAGRRVFYKKIRCHWTSGHSWTKALFFSLTLGGFGVDRFYLGHWKSAIGKLFSFGGLGIWTLLDIVLIAIGYIQPADESLYV